MPWDPTGVPDVQLTISADGSFVWQERDADCGTVGLASGSMWVAIILAAVFVHPLLGKPRQLAHPEVLGTSEAKGAAE